MNKKQAALFCVLGAALIDQHFRIRDLSKGLTRTIDVVDNLVDIKIQEEVDTIFEDIAENYDN